MVCCILLSLQFPMVHDLISMLILLATKWLILIKPTENFFPVSSFT